MYNYCFCKQFCILQVYNPPFQCLAYFESIYFSYDYLEPKKSDNRLEKCGIRRMPGKLWIINQRKMLILQD